ncbi:MAG: glutamine-hydrolyzing carbamoyl-phosphate synthase small subunit [Chloroflexota bacterium]|nr:glutamine-hydrolyzing carbamoyl-phosphate synthase small subunit [Chloroflexota bacterium]
MILVLEDGAIFHGYSFGSETSAYGEVVFNTSMVGYQEILTDPSYAGQIVVPTYPLIGNYGINDDDVESNRIQVRGFIVRESCSAPSHWQSRRTLHEYLYESAIPGMYGIDTRALTRRLRSKGVMMGVMTSEKNHQEALDWLSGLPQYGSVDFVREVSTSEPYRWQSLLSESISDSAVHIVVIDCGLKFNILRILHSLGCRVTVVPCTYSIEDIMILKPNGVLVSPGPGDPALLDNVAQTIMGLMNKLPMMGICLGEQIMARALGARTFKLKFGHRGGNHPVREIANGRVYITAQNHGYAVDADSLRGGLEVSHINLNDDTVEGICHREIPIFGIQYHSEASPGPEDNMYLFTRFMDMVRDHM